MFQTDASQLRLSNAKSDAGFDGFSTTQLHVVCKCALSYILPMTKFENISSMFNVQCALTLQINWSNAKTCIRSQQADKKKGYANGFTVDHILTFSLPNKIILFIKIPFCDNFFRSFHLLFGVIFIANMN